MLEECLALASENLILFYSFYFQTYSTEQQSNMQEQL
jgi:hypothetical protein